MTNDKKTWSARFSEVPDARAAAFNASVRFDKRLAQYDITASLAHAKMLAAQGIISNDDDIAIADALKIIRKEITDGVFVWRDEDEDVHMNIERRLIEIAGKAGGRLHTARSRNDQVATDLRLYLRDETDVLIADIKTARLFFLAQAEEHANTLAPGMTHMQIAQPVSFGHHLLAYDDMLARDGQRFADCRRRINRSPLGACALAGAGYPIDREMTAAALGFDGVCENAMDAVSDRDFAVEFAAAAALLKVHLSRFCEEVILWSSPAFAFVQLPDSLCTGSSVMPQKKNPDVPELVRGKCGRVSGALMALLMMLKGQPLAYNKDNQEDKEVLFDCVDTVRECLCMTALTAKEMSVNPQNMRRLLDLGYPTATELADYLVKSGMPFRQAHGAVAAIVREAAGAQLRLEDLSLEFLRKHIPDADEGAKAALSAETAVAAREHTGGTAPKEVLRQIAKRRKALGAV